MSNAREATSPLSEKQKRTIANVRCNRERTFVRAIDVSTPRGGENLIDFLAVQAEIRRYPR